MPAAPQPITPTATEPAIPPGGPDWLETEYAAPTPTPAPYWDFRDLVTFPDGGWTIYRNEEFGLSFEYPVQYDEGPCGAIYLERGEGEVAILFEGGAMGIVITEGWDGDLADYVSGVLSENPLQLLTSVESFSIDGVPALRVIRHHTKPSASAYDKLAFVGFGGRLYSFHYVLMNWVFCDADGISEEAVYEHLIATWHFYR